MSSSSEQLDDRVNISFVDYVDSLRIPYEDIELATNNFSDANLLPIQSPSSSSFRKLIYKGQLEQSRGQLIDIVARLILEAQDNIVFNELITSYLLTHKNILPVFKISGTDDPIIINKYEANESLDKHLSDSNLTWIQRLHICVGVAHALSYIHDFDPEGDFSVIHGNIKSSKILLDKFWEPKLNCFGFSMFVKKHQPHLTSNYSGALQYTDPAYVNTGCLTHECDVFSFGVVLFEVLFGEIASVKDEDNWYFAKFARSSYEKKTLDNIINIDLHKQMDLQSLHIFSETAYCCLKEVSTERLNMVQIVKKLEASLELQQNHESLMNFESNTYDAPMKVNIIVGHPPTAPETEIMSKKFAHLKVPLEDVISATNNFAKKNFMGEDDFGNHYMGQLLWSGELINIHARRWLNKERNDEKEQQFWMEISMLSTLKHKHMVSLVGFCDDNDEKVIIIKLATMGSLNNYLSDPMLLTWVRRLEICVGVAHALSYIHYDEQRNFSVIHRNIDSETILLNDNWEPKLSEFRLSMKIEASQRHRSFHVDKVCDMKGQGYTDPKYIETKSVSHKSDMYSCGIVLFELLCGRKSIIANDTNKYLAPVAITHYREKKLHEIIDWGLWQQMNSQSFDIFAKTAYDCLNEEQSQRPHIDEIVTRLEKALELQLEHQKAIMSEEFTHLKVPLENIRSATDNFAEENILCTSEFERRYMGQLLWSGELIGIEARRWRFQEEQRFWMNISLLSTLKHKNLVSLVGFCDENDEKIIIIKHEKRGGLSHYLSDSVLLTWVRRLEICVGIAHALSYIHYDEPHDFSVIHRSVCSANVVLNDDWEPKLYYFDFSMKIEASQRHHSFHTNKVEYVDGYGDRTYIETKSVNHKSDIYSFGIVMFELLCGRKSLIANDTNKYLAPVAITHYREKRLDDIIDWDPWKQLDSQSFNIFAETAYDCLNEERSQRPNIDEIIPKLEKALKLARENRPIMSEEFAHLRVPLENILSATNNFSEENCIGTSGFAKEYKGQLLWSGELIELYARRLSKEWDGVEQLFWTGISMLSSLKHKNVVSLVGFCDENDEKILIIMLETRASLTNYLSDPMLTWVRRLEICVAIAHALSYIHYDEARDFSVIHGSLCSANVLLNDDWEPKLSEFEFSMKIKASQRHHSFHTSKLEYVNGYGDPTYIETKRLSHKSDIYSFGIVMLELLCGRKSISEHPDNKYLAGTAIFHYKMEILDEIIDPDLWKQMDPQSFKVFAQTAYDCLNEERPQRPNIHEIVTRLETALKLQMERQDAVHSIVVAEVEDTSSNHDEGSLTSVSTHVESHLSKKTKSFLKDLSHLKLSWKDITSATNNFAQENIVRKFRFGTIYKGHLLQSDQSIDITAKRFNLDYLKDERKRFWTEVSMLSSLKHKNLVSIIGFYDDEEDKIIIYKEANRSLEAYLSDQTLTWMQRLKICVGVAKALSYIHYDPGRDFSVIHCNIMSSNILLDDKWEPKLSGFELLLKNTVARRHRLLLTTDIVKNVYLDPEYKKTGGVTHKSDVYSFGVVLFSVLYGRSVDEDELGERLSSQLEKSHLEDMVDPQLRKQMDPESFGIFSETAYYCLQEKRVKRPYIDQVVKRLDKAFELQWKHENLWKNLEHLKIGLNDIELATENFANTYCIGEGRYGLVYKAQLEHFDSSKSSLIDWGNKCDLPKKRSIVAIKRIFNTQGEQGLIKLATQSFIQENIIGHGDSGNVYRGHTDGHNIIATKRLDRKSTEGEAEFMTELKILIEYKHEKVIGLLGYSDEEDEKVIVYEYASRGSLDKYLNNDCLTWVMRLKICIDVAIGLEFLHGTVSSSEMVIHRDVNSSSILLLDDWKAKITDFGLSLVCPTNQDVDYVIDNPRGTIGYRDPLYVTTGFLTKESDIFSLGAVLFDVLCGKLSSVKLDDEYLYLPFLAKQHYYLGKLDELVFEGIKEQIEPQSFITFARVAYQCIHHRRERRPSAQEVVMQLKKALEFQEDYEKWEPKLPKDYKEIIQMSKCPEIYSTKKKEELYNIFSKGILLQQDKVLLSFEGNGERNEMVSATMFSFINSCPHEWKSLPSSRFGTVVEMLDISNLSFEIKIDAQFLSPDVVYGAFLVFRLCDSRIFSSKPMCVNLKYRKGLESRQSYFATWRDKDWMMIELYQFLNQNEDVVFEFLIESFSSYYCGESAVYVEGIEFRAIDRIKHEEIGKMKEAEQVLKTKFNADQVQHLPTNFEEIFKICRNYDEFFWLGEISEKKLLVLSAKAALYKYSNVDLFTLQPSALSRFQVVIELLPQQVFHINCTIKSQMLSPDTEYVCYLMFKLSEQCQGLHCPVKVRDLLHQENNEADFFYFITPSPLNINDITRVSKQREDGWMEIQLWKFNSTHEFKDGSLSMNMKFTSHEGIMSGLIVCGLEFRPM